MTQRHVLPVSLFFSVRSLYYVYMNNQSNDKKKPIGGLWAQTSKAGNHYLSGEINGQKIIVFSNSFKEEGSNQPDWKIYEKEDRQQQQGQQNQGPYKQANDFENPKPQGPSFNDTEIPF